SRSPPSLVVICRPAVPRCHSRLCAGFVEPANLLFGGEVSQFFSQSLSLRIAVGPRGNTFHISAHRHLLAYNTTLRCGFAPVRLALNPFVAGNDSDGICG